MPRMSRGLVLALAWATAAGLAGCSGDLPAPANPGERLVATPPSASAIPSLDTVRGLVLPTDAYRPTTQELHLVLAAEDKLTADCMSRYGLTWPTTTGHQTADQIDRLYGVGDLAAAQQYGYHTPPDSGREARQRQRSRSDQRFSPTELMVLNGGDGRSKARSYQGKQIPDGGCAGEARRRVTGVDEIDPTRLADTITVEMWNRSKSDQRVVEVIQAWSACMKRSGYDYRSPLEVNDPGWSVTGPITAVEIQVAVTDVQCKQSTNLIGTWFTIESGYERQAIQQHLEQVTAIKKRWTSAARTAAQLLSRPAQP